MAIRTVPSPYSTIQAAINASTPNDTVLVGPGTYYEVITINKPLTVKSTNGPSQTIINGNHATENYYIVTIAASNVILDGFTLTNPIYNFKADASGVVFDSGIAISGVRVTNNIITKIGVSSRSPVDFGTFGINLGPADGIEIDNNIIHDLQNGDAGAYAIGIFLWGNSENEIVTNINIHDNRIYDIITPGTINCGIRLDEYTGNAIISNNIIGSSIKIGIVTDSAMVGPVTISGNTINSASDYGAIFDNPFGQTVTGNTFSNSDTGIHVSSSADLVEVHFNNITGNRVGMDNFSSNSVNASCNWWGSSLGPNSPGADTINSVENYTPWLNAPYPAGVCTGGAPISSGPVVADKDAKSLVVKVLNNSGVSRNVTVKVYDIEACKKTVIYKMEFINISPNCTADAIFAAPPIEYEVVFEGIVQGVEVWAAARKNTPKAELKQSSFIEANTFKNIDFVPIVGDTHVC